MFFAIITLLSALSLAGVAGWFSIIGMMAIFAGAPIQALILGVVVEVGKLVTTSWIYRNWEHSDWRLKTPLIAATAIVMLVTSIGVFGFLSKAHLEQGASTLDNSARVERLDQQIAREKSVIADNEKVISQLDATINSYLGKDRADRSVTIRRSQAPQRKQLRDDIDAAQKKIDTLSEERFTLQSEVRKLELEVGPIRYISEIMYGTSDTEKNVEAAVRMFTLLIVSTLDPLAIILLIAANHTLLRLQNEKKKKTEEERHTRQDSDIQAHAHTPAIPIHAQDAQLSENKGNDEPISEDIPVTGSHVQEAEVHVPIPKEDVEILVEDKAPVEEYIPAEMPPALPTILQPTPTLISNVPEAINITDHIAEPKTDTGTKEAGPWMSQNYILSELLGSGPHFIPEKINEEEKINTSSTSDDTATTAGEEVHIGSEISGIPNKAGQEEPIWSQDRDSIQPIIEENRRSSPSPVVLSWLKEFKGNTNGQ